MWGIDDVGELKDPISKHAHPDSNMYQVGDGDAVHFFGHVIQFGAHLIWESSKEIARTIIGM